MGSGNMNDANRVIEIANQNNGYVTTKQVKEKKINTIVLTRLVEQKKVRKNSKRLLRYT